MKFDKSCHIYGLFQPIMIHKGILFVLSFFFLTSLQAQQEIPVDYMRSTGKIYVVAGVTFIILITLLVYMIIIDRKITRLEKQHKNE
jgi:hypothetical protein